MSAIERIAYSLNRRDEEPNELLAVELAAAQDTAGIQEIAANLWNQNANIASDCLKVLYQIGYTDPGLIAPYTADFLNLLRSKNNRMVWGAMIALATVASLQPHEIWEQVNLVMRTVEGGTVITVVWGVRALSQVAAADPTYNQKIFPFLLAQLQKCLPRDVPLHAESMLPAVTATNKGPLLAVLEERKPDLSAAQASRLKKVMKKLG
jgi:hypothetical protein